MSALPPFVIQNAQVGQQPLYLGQAGWTPLRSAALSFQSQDDGESWLTAARHAHRGLFTGPGSEAKVSHVPYQPRDEAGRMVADYDPLTHEG